MADDDVTELAAVLCESGTCTYEPAHACTDHAEAILASPWLARRDARIRAEVLRDAADWLRDDMDEPWGMRAGSRLDARADRIEREGHR